MQNPQDIRRTLNLIVSSINCLRNNMVLNNVETKYFYGEIREKFYDIIEILDENIIDMIVEGYEEELEKFRKNRYTYLEKYFHQMRNLEEEVRAHNEKEPARDITKKSPRPPHIQFLIDNRYKLIKNEEISLTELYENYKKYVENNFPNKALLHNRSLSIELTKMGLDKVKRMTGIYFNFQNLPEILEKYTGKSQLSFVDTEEND